MSSSIMNGRLQMLFDPKSVGLALVYGCGPNYIFGAIAIPIISIIIIKRYIRGENISNGLKILKFLSLGLIPIVGGIIGLMFI